MDPSSTLPGALGRQRLGATERSFERVWEGPLMSDSKGFPLSGWIEFDVMA